MINTHQEDCQFDSNLAFCLPKTKDSCFRKVAKPQKAFLIFRPHLQCPKTLIYVLQIFNWMGKAVYFIYNGTKIKTQSDI